MTQGQILTGIFVSRTVRFMVLHKVNIEVEYLINLLFMNDVIGVHFFSRVFIQPN